MGAGMRQGLPQIYLADLRLKILPFSGAGLASSLRACKRAWIRVGLPDSEAEEGDE